MSREEHAGRRPFLRTPIGLALVVFLAMGAFLLVAEHRAHIFTGSWFLWLLPLGCIVMHLFHGHGSHGGHRDHQGPEDGGRSPKDR